MKNTNKHIEHLVSETLGSTSAYRRYDGNPYLFTRISHELNKQTEAKTPTWFHRYSLQFKYSLAMVLIILNLGTVWYLMEAKNTSSENYEMQMLASEFIVYNGESDLSN